MKKLTLILLLAIAKIGFAQNNNSQQDTTLIYSSPMYTKDPVRSKWRPVVKRVGEFYQVTFYDKKDVIQEIISFEDKDLTVRKGPFLMYKNGKESEKGTYDKGHKHGEWLKYDIDGVLAEKQKYNWGKLNGLTVKYWNNQQVQEEGNYEDGRKIGEWRLFYKDAKPAGTETYDEYGKIKQAEYFFNDGRPAKYEDLFHPPTYKGGIRNFYKFLTNEIQYPKNAAREKISGTVFLSFLVRKDGGIEDIRVDKNPNNELTIEAIRVLQKSNEWEAGIKFGEKVSTRFNMPIKFSIR